MRRQERTASKMPLAGECAGAFALEAFPDGGSKWAERGQVIHEFIDTAMKLGRDAALQKVPLVHLEACSGIDLDHLRKFFDDATPKTEVPVAWNAKSDKGVRLEVTRARGYEVVPGAGWIPGTVDAVHVILDHVNRNVIILFADWKTGYLWVAHPKRNRQVHTYALALARMAQAKFPGYDIRVEAMIVYVDEEGEPAVVRTEFHAMELDALAADLREVNEAVDRAIEMQSRGERPDVRPGEWCRYCAAFPSCPAQAGAATSLVEISKRPFENLTPSDAGAAWALLLVVEAAAEKMREALKGMAERAHLPMPDGRKVVAVPMTTEIISPRVLREVLEEREMGPAFIASVTVGRNKLQKAIEDKAVLAEVKEELKKRGGLTTVENHQIKAVSKNWKPKEER